MSLRAHSNSLAASYQFPRFNSITPAGYVDSANLYGYVAGNPVGWVDSFGLDGQLSDLFGSDPVQFGSGGGFASLADAVEVGLTLGEPQDRLDQLLDEVLMGLDPSGLPHHRYTRQEWEDEQSRMWLHNFLDSVGVIPVVGDIADALNAIIYITEGDWLNAAVSGASIILPGAALGGRATVKLLFNNADDAAYAARLLQSGANPEAVVRAAGHGRMQQDFPLPVVNPHFDVTHGPGCFVAGTLVATEDGLRPIEELEPGERVWSFDCDTDEWVLCEIEATSAREYVGDIVTIEIECEDGTREVIQSTGNHPFWVEAGENLHERPAAEELPETEPKPNDTGRWVEASVLRLEDRAVTRSVGPARIIALTTREVSCRVYNLHVGRVHNYAIGEACTLVHNTQNPCSVGRYGEMPAPRPDGMAAHHGAMSAWMRAKFGKAYDHRKAPAILVYDHEASFGVFNRWRVNMAQKMGGTFSWTNVTMSDMRRLADEMFDAMNVPREARETYWKEFKAYYNDLMSGG